MGIEKRARQEDLKKPELMETVDEMRMTTAVKSLMGSADSKVADLRREDGCKRKSADERCLENFQENFDKGYDW